jgi:GDP-fucose transporter C1
MMAVAGVLGFLIGIVTVMQIQVTSPLTHNISGTAKACVQTLLAYVVWQNDSTVKGNIGVFLVILGSGIYAYVRMLEMDAQAAAKRAGTYMPVQSQAGVVNAAEDATSPADKESIEMRAQQKV